MNSSNPSCGLGVWGLGLCGVGGVSLDGALNLINRLERGALDILHSLDGGLLSLLDSLLGLLRSLKGGGLEGSERISCGGPQVIRLLLDLAFDALGLLLHLALESVHKALSLLGDLALDLKSHVLGLGPQSFLSPDLVDPVLGFGELGLADSESGVKGWHRHWLSRHSLGLLGGGSGVEGAKELRDHYYGCCDLNPDPVENILQDLG
mmetsp:Transcript_29817/g.46765  ORF Transcript_29817/g.46765 Transcript_29817/m.46765 type:complete len:207 (+) Transcript_29817:379-999(+)